MSGTNKLCICGNCYESDKSHKCEREKELRALFVKIRNQEEITKAIKYLKSRGFTPEHYKQAYELEEKNNGN